MLDAESLSFDSIRVPKFYDIDKLTPASRKAQEVVVNRGSLDTVATESPAESPTSGNVIKSHILETIITWTSLHGLEEGKCSLSYDIQKLQNRVLNRGIY